MIGGQADVFVERETTGLPERDQPGVAAGGQFVVDRQRRRTGRQAEHCGRLSGQQGTDGVCADAADVRGALQDDDFHVICWP